MTATELARKAIEILRSDGWTQGDFCTRVGTSFSYCLLGAVFRADGYTDEELRAHRIESVSVAARQVVNEVGLVAGVSPSVVTGERFANVHAWNDKPERTRDEVIRVLTIAAANLAVA